ncbi:MAG: CARDB domain-containing protein, partial [Candidatus Promineifilaceae bacterium]
GTPFDKEDDFWQTYTSADNAFLTNGVRHIAVDDAGYKWFGSQSGLVVLDEGDLANKGDDIWQTFDQSDGLACSNIHGIVIDDQGILWLSCGGWLTAMDDGGTPFEKGDDLYQNFQVSVFDDITEFAIDEMGNKWLLLYDEYSPEGVRVLDDGGTPFDPANDAWQSFTTDDGLIGGKLTSIVIDENGRKWFGTDGSGISVLEDGGTLFDKSDDSWRTITEDDGLVDDRITTMAIDNDGTLFIGTWRSGVNVVASTGATIWESDIALDLEYGLGIEPGMVSQAITSVQPIAASGKYYLEAELLSPNGQRIAKDISTFYIFDADTGLIMESDKDLYRPGQEIILSGQVFNGSGASITDQTLTVTQDGVIIFTDGPFDVPASGSHPFTVTTTAPPSPGSIAFQASVDGITLDDKVDVVVPEVQASIEGPDLVGDEPFTVTVVLNNIGLIEAAVSVTMGGVSEDVTIPDGEVRIVQQAFQIQGDATIMVELVGDLVQTLEHAVEYGLSAEVAFAPQESYCAGLSEIPYTLTNTGQLDIAFTTYVTFSHTTLAPAYAQLDALLPISATLQGSLVHTLQAGDYSMDWMHPFGNGQASFTVRGYDLASMEVVTGPVVNGMAPVTVTVTNLGCDNFGGYLILDAGTSETPFYGKELPLNTAPDASEIITFSVGTAGIAPGTFTMTVSLVNSERTPIDTITTTGNIPGPDLLLTTLPTQTMLYAGDTVDMVFEVQNQGGTGGKATLTFGLGDLEDETQMKWIGAGASGYFTYTFYLPPDLSSGDYLAAYALTGTLGLEIDHGEILYPVEGISLTVDAETDKPAYLEGDPALLSLSIGNAGQGDTGDLTAMISFNGITQTQSFSLSYGASAQLDFPLTASFEGDHLVFYGIYHSGTDRSIYLNTHHLNRQHPAVTIVTDKQQYRPGDTVSASLITALTQGDLTVYAPGFEGEVPIGDTNSFDFDLSAVMARGTYYIEYTTHGSGTSEDGRQHRTLFDVDGPVVYVRDAVLTSIPESQGDPAVLDLTVTSDRELDATLVSWIRYPDDHLSSEFSQPVHLLPLLNNHLVISMTIAEAQMGQYALFFELEQEGDSGGISLAQGSKIFDVGPAQLDGMTVDQGLYPNADDPVVASLEIYSSKGGVVEAQLILDQGPSTTLPLTLSAGFQTMTATLTAPIPPGHRHLTATLTSGGFEAVATTFFDYGTDLADLRPGLPWIGASGEETRTLSSLVINDGGSTSAATYAHFYDGDPVVGGTLIGIAVVPALETGEFATAEVVWSILGQGGDHILHVRIDPVTEFDTTNNQAQAAISLPRFDAELELSATAVEIGDAVTAGVTVENLQDTLSLPITVTMQIRSPRVTVVYSHTWIITLDPGETQYLSEPWSVDSEAATGYYAVVGEVWDDSGGYWLQSHSISVKTVTERHVYVPLLRR